MIWRYRGALYLTIIAKTSHGLAAPHAPMAPEALDGFDRHYGGDSARPVRTPSDAVAQLPRAELLHAGSVFAPAGVTMARLALFRGEKAVIDIRKLAKAADDSPGLGPLARASAERTALLAGRAAPAFDAAGCYAIPDAFDFAFEQAARPDQQCDELLAGDRVLLVNLHRTSAELVVPLPLAPPTARVTGGGDHATPPFRCRRVLIDTDRDRITMTWLTLLPLPVMNAASRLRVDLAAPPASSPSDRAVVAGRAPSTPSAVPRMGAGAAAVASGTMLIQPPKAAVGTGTMILADGAASAPRAPLPGPPAPRRASTPDTMGTLLIEDEAPAPSLAMPFARKERPTQARKNPAASATPWAQSDADRPKAAPAASAALGLGTMTIDLDPEQAKAFRPVLPAPPPPLPVAQHPVDPPDTPAPDEPGPDEPAPDALAPDKPAAAAPVVAPPKRTGDDIWAKQPDAVAVAPPPKPKLAPRANPIAMLYRKGK